MDGGPGDARLTPRELPEGAWEHTMWMAKRAEPLEVLRA